VGVIGGGPAGAFFSYFLLQLSDRMDLDLSVDVYEPRQFSLTGPRGCNMCGGIISESLVQHLATEGIHLPVSVIRRRIDSYVLHMDVGSVHIETPRHEKRIAAVHRGGGPKGHPDAECGSFDSYLLDLALARGAHLQATRVEKTDWDAGRPRVTAAGGDQATYDLLAVAVGVNSPLLGAFERPEIPYRPPKRTKAFVCEFFLGIEMLRRYIGSSMHVYMLDIPGLEFAAIIPKSDYVTVCLLGENIDKTMVDAFLNSTEVRETMPPHWSPPTDYCHCSPRISIASAIRPFADRMVFVGDCGTTRLFKDGIGAAYRTSKAAALTAVFHGISGDDFRRNYWPACRRIGRDNDIGKVVFGITGQIRKRRFARRGLWRMVAREQKKESVRRHMSQVLWDTFTGSAPYRTVFLRSLHPAFLGQLAHNTIVSNWPRGDGKSQGRLSMGTGLMGKNYNDGQIIYRQGELGDCMYVIHEGQVDEFQRKGDQEFLLRTLEKGDFFGEMALFADDARPSTMRASGKAVILTLEKKTLLQRIHEEPSLAFRLLHRMTLRIRDLEGTLVRRSADVVTE
jgi:flavin-dependent dehydrogenase